MPEMTKEVYDLLVRHGRDEAPIEACGYLAADGDGRIRAAFPMTNTDRSHDHYTMDPQEQFAVVKEIRNRGLRLCGVYHSHPASPARPSEEDIRLAFDPNLYYVIVTLIDNDAPLRAFTIRQGRVEEQRLAVIEQEPAVAAAG